MLAEVEGAVELGSKRKGVLVVVLQQVHPLSYRNYFITLASNKSSRKEAVSSFSSLTQLNRNNFQRPPPAPLSTTRGQLDAC